MLNLVVRKETASTKHSTQSGPHVEFLNVKPGDT
jgi:hypothetical protein